MKPVKPYLSFLVVLLLASCASPPIKDGPPPRDIDVSLIPDAVPRLEPITAAGNKSPYQVFGRTYQVMPSSKGYRERGKASWYGTKFHGRQTSNGETYDMYAMTAAHRTLPIPSYVQVTNLDNGRKVIVRVNDRGPFHGDRIIDLSWVAAKKLGYHDEGISRVEVVAIDPVQFQRNTVELPRMAHQQTEAQSQPAAVGPLPGSTYLQAGAFGTRQAAERKQRHLIDSTGYPVEIREGAGGGQTLFKVLVGPIADQASLADVRALLLSRDNVASFIVTE